MIKTKDDFYNRLQSCMAPIYFFDQNAGIPEDTSRLTINGTLTLFQKNNKVFGITNYHVYQEYLDQKAKNADVICQIGHKLVITLENRVLHQDKRNDLTVFFLDERELTVLGNKSGFRRINCAIEEIIQKYQSNDDSKTWQLHCAGFPGSEKLTTKVGPKEIQENFGFCILRAPAIYYYGDFTNGDKIALCFSDSRQAIEKDLIKIDDKKNLIPHALSLGGISGGPVFARVFPYEDDLTLLGIVYQGPSGNKALPENIYARPISLIENILQEG